MSYGLGAYKKTSIHTASKEQILLMLYQAAIKNVKKGMDAIDNKEIAKKGEFIGKFQDIIIELNNSLDFEIGGEVAKELSSLYDFMLYSSTQANIKIDKAPLEACLNEGWTEAIKEIRKDKANSTEGEA